MERWRAELVLAAGATLGEAPVWDPRDEVLDWVDLERGRWHRFDPRTGTQSSRTVGPPACCVARRAGGGHVIAGDGAFVVFDRAGVIERRIEVAMAGGERFNDGGCDARGRFWCGTMAETPGAGALHRLDPDGSVQRMLDGVTASNGLDWSLDGRSLYYVDTATGTLDVLDHDPVSGALGGRRTLVEITDGLPDGLTVDAGGDLWLAVWGAGELRRYRPDGVLTGVVAVSTPYVTSGAFGGSDLETLWITTARRDGSHQAGGLFAGRVGVRGRPAPVCGL